MARILLAWGVVIVLLVVAWALLLRRRDRAGRELLVHAEYMRKRGLAMDRYMESAQGHEDRMRLSEELLDLDDELDEKLGNWHTFP